jgi:uncharacterized membrane protein YeaQ/YmgE (transglycosylase-associated protein family)
VDQVSAGAQLLLVVLVIGLVVGGLAAVTSKGRWTIGFVIAGVLGSCVGLFFPILPWIGVHLNSTDITLITQCIIMAIVFVILLRIALSFKRA